MVFRFYLKLTASRKTEQSDGKTKNIPQIQGFRMRYSKSNSSLPGLTITESLWKTSRVYHVVFPHIQLELNGKTVQFIGRDCIVLGAVCFTDPLHRYQSGLFSSSLL